MSVNIPWITELYANYGRIGIFLGMALIGSFMGLLDRLFNAPRTNVAEKAIAAGLVLPFFYQESNFTLMTGSLLPLALTMWIYFVFGMGAVGWIKTRHGRAERGRP